MIKKCPKCYRELDTDKDFCVLCGESYKNEELDKKINKKIEEERIKEENKEEKEESSIIPAIIYGLGALILGPFVFIINIAVNFFSNLDGGSKPNTPLLWIVLEVIVGICFIGAIVSLVSRKSNKK
jgi:uncharacterized membrane protein YvbJ